MKKLILSLLIFCSAFASAQISIPQVTGLPAALNSKVDKATGKSLIADTLSAKIQPTATAVATKEPLLPSTPYNPESRFLNGNKQWAEIVLGSGGYASNVYFTNLTSAIVGTYKQTSGTHELTETIASGTCNNNEVLIYTYLFEQPVGITTVDAGVWRFTMNCAINSNVGDSKFKIVQFRRSSTGVETDMFTIYSNTIENTDYQNFVIETVQPSFLVDSLDRFGCRIYATTTTTVNKTISYKVGDGYASYLNTPLALRHPQLRDPNGNPNVQHLTAAQVTKVNNTSGINTGDETLTSIKTKLGAATAVSDGYLRYQDFALLHTPTTVTASNGLSISGQNISLQDASLTQSGALTFNDYNRFDSKEPAITKNSGFNLPLGTTPGTVLEGRTFGTAANSAVGDFVQVNPAAAQTGSIWMNGGLKANQFGLPVTQSILWGAGYSAQEPQIEGTSTGFNIYPKGSNTTDGVFNVEGKIKGMSFQSTVANGTAPLTVNSTTMVSNLNADLLDGNHASAFQPTITGLSTNYIPKWNGSNFVNSLISDDGSRVIINGDIIYSGSNKIYPYGSNQNLSIGSSQYINFDIYDGSWNTKMKLANNGNVLIGTTTDNGYKLAVNGSGYFNGILTMGSSIHSYTTEALRVIQDNGYLSFFNTAGNTRAGYIQSSPNSIYIAAESGSGDIQLINKNVVNVRNDNGGAAKIQLQGSQSNAKQYSILNGITEISNTGFSIHNDTNGTTPFYIDGGDNSTFNGNVTASQFNGSGAGLTNVQMPIALTTNGTSGAATFSGNTLNIPNYTSNGSFIQNQTTSAQTGGLWVSGIIQTNNTLYAAAVASHHVDVDEINITIAGTSGNATFIQPFRGIAYKKVIINLTGFVGNVNWSYPTAFTNTPVILMTDGLASTLITSKSTTSVTVTSATATTGILILEGY